MTNHQVNLTLDNPGERLDRALVQALPQLSRTAVQKLIKDGQVLVDGRVAKASQQLEGGEQVQVGDTDSYEARCRRCYVPFEPRPNGNGT